MESPPRVTPKPVRYFTGASTPTANFYYDEPSFSQGGSTFTLNNTIGRLSHTTAANGNAKTVYSYDPMGRISLMLGCTPQNCGGSAGNFFYSSYTYDKAGDVTQWTHPAGFNITNTVSNAQRITQITSSLSDTTHPATLAQNIVYTPFGALSSLQDGCAGTGCVSRQETYAYNNRLQPAMIQLGTNSSNAANSCLVYNYYPGTANPTSCALPSQGTGNNGNMMGYYYMDNTNTNIIHWAAETYDSLNRLATHTVTPGQSGGPESYSQTFIYDQYGNVTCWGSGNCAAPYYDATTNRMSGTGVSYDAAGNNTSDGTGTGSHSYTWDAEGRMTSVSVSGLASATYTYNALGQRVEKNVNSGTYTEYVYDASGNVVMTTNRTTVLEDFLPLGGRIFAKYANGVTYFMHPNAVGTSLEVTDNTGAVIQDLTYYPHGGRAAYVGTTLIDERFASLSERDTESYLDWTPNRVHDPTMMRWLSPDPLGGDVTNPQSLNRYAYVLNNPINLTDVLGLDPQDDPGGFFCGDPFYAVSHAECPDIPRPGGGIIWGLGGRGGGGGGGTPPGAGGATTTSSGPTGGGSGGIFSGGASGPLSGDFGPLGLPGGGFGIPCDFGTCGGAVPGSGFQAGEEVAAGIGLWELIKEGIFWGGFALANRMSKPNVRTLQDVVRNCTPGARVEEPATGRDYRGGTSVEQEYVCSDGSVWTIHWITRNGKVIHGPHIRGGPPKGGGGS